jgi:arylsulfatase A-like enzyme
MIIVNPEEREAQVRRMFVSLIDLLPTLAELCGVSLDCPIDGKSFAKNLKAGKDDSFRPYAISESFDLCHSGKGEYENPEHYTAEKWRAMNICIRAEHDKYIFHGKDSDEYYDMMEDPYENCNLYPNKVSQERISELRTIILDELEKSGTVLANLVQAKMKA